MIPFTLVTTCRNEMRSFPRWKENIIAQTRFPDEIVIVDAFSDDGTWEEIQKWSQADPRVRGIQEKGAAAHGRNFAIENAKFEHIVSTDMGVRIAECFCEELIKPFENDPTIEIVLGNSCIDPESLKTLSAKTEWYIENGCFFNPKPGDVGGNRASAYLKRLWKELGGLPEDLTFYADDSTFFRQVNEKGYKTAYAWEAMTYWGRTGILSKYWRESFVYARGDGEAAIKMSGSFKLYLQKKIPLWIERPLNALRFMQKKCTWKATWNALKHGDILVPFLMPIYAWGMGWNQSKGYLVGYLNGNSKCQACRQRLSESRQNLALDKRFK